MKISILNAQQVIFEGVVSSAILPGVDGELDIMDDHEPIFVALSRGLVRLSPIAKRVGVRVTGEAGRIQEMRPVKIQRGVARMKANELVILVE